MVDDSTLDDAERIELMVDYMTSVDESVNAPSIAKDFIRLYREELAGLQKPDDLSKITAKAVAACLDVLRAPEIRTVTSAANEAGIDTDLKKLLLKQYDDDAKLSKEFLSQIGQEEEDEIMGLGRNENKTRIAREREEQREAMKRESAEAHEQKIAQKLKAQGDRIRDKTVRGKRS